MWKYFCFWYSFQSINWHCSIMRGNNLPGVCVDWKHQVQNKFFLYEPSSLISLWNLACLPILIWPSFGILSGRQFLWKAAVQARRAALLVLKICLSLCGCACMACFEKVSSSGNIFFSFFSSPSLLRSDCKSLYSSHRFQYLHVGHM